MVALLVIGTFMVFILTDGLVQYAQTHREKVSEQALPVALPDLHLGSISIPAGLFLAPAHTWAALERSGNVSVGMDQFAQRVIGRIDRVRLPQAGRQVKRGEALFEVTNGKRAATFLSPVDGVVDSVNEVLAEDGKLIDESPYSKGWICSMQPTNLAEDMKKLMISQEAVNWLRREGERFRNFFSRQIGRNLALGTVIPDGGEIVPGALQGLDEETWRRFGEKFLRMRDELV